MKNIIIYGMRGSGKSTIGKLLAKKLNKSFYDLDKYIESIINLKLKNYIESNSWESFRCLENKCLSDILNTNENFVLSLGGGTIIPNPI